MTAVEPVVVDTVVTGEWILTLNANREIYHDGAIAVSGGTITEVGKRAAILYGGYRVWRHRAAAPAAAVGAHAQTLGSGR